MAGASILQTPYIANTNPSVAPRRDNQGLVPHALSPHSPSAVPSRIHRATYHPTPTNFRLHTHHLGVIGWVV